MVKIKQYRYVREKTIIWEKFKKEKYPMDLAETTYKYMIIPDYMNEKIKNNDWSMLHTAGFFKYNSDYKNLYNKVIKHTLDFDLFFKECYGVCEYHK